MKINISDINTEHFLLKEGVFFGKDSVLINPVHIGCPWTQDNKIFRSSIWSKSGELLSAGFPKFTNWGELPFQFPVPEDVSKCNIVEKLDGSLCIVDYSPEWGVSIRTRGTFSYQTLDNSKDFEEISKINLHKFFNLIGSNVTLLFEITTPNNRIVIDYGSSVDFKLIGAVDKVDYSLFNQHELDYFAFFLECKRPRVFKFDSLTDLFSIRDWKDFEGVCVYSSNGQTIHKIKTIDYLKKHAFKNNISFKSLLDLYLANNLDSRKGLEDLIVVNFDYECLEMANYYLDNLFNCIGYVKDRVSEAHSFYDELAGNGLVMKDIAIQTLSKYKGTGYDSVVFSRARNREIDESLFKKLVYAALELQDNKVLVSD